MKKDAEISVGADTSAAEQAAGRVREAFREAASDLTKDMGGAAKAVVGDLMRVATQMAHVNFSSLHADVRSFEAQTAQLAIATGRSLEDVRAHFNAVGTEINKRPSEVAAWAHAVGELTGSFDDAADSMQGMTHLATMTGRNVQSYQGMAQTLGVMGVKGREVADVVGTIKSQADKLGGVTSVAQITDQFAAAGDAVTQFTTKGNDGIKQMTAFLGVLGKDLNRVAAVRVGTQALNALSADPRGWERYLHRHIIDDKTGQIENPATVYRDIYNKTAKRFHGEDLRNVMINNFGAELGVSLLNAGKRGDFSKVGELAKAPASKAGKEALDAMKATDAGQRDAAEVKLFQSAEKLMGSSTALGTAADKLQQFAAAHPVVANAAGAAVGVAGSTASGAVGGIVGGLIKGGSGGAAAVLAGKASLAILGTGAAVVGAGVAGAYGGGKLGQYLSDRYGDNGDAAVAAANVELARMKAIRDKKRAERGWTPAPTTESTPQQNQQPAISDQALEQAVSRGMASAKFTIINATGGPVDVANANGQSASSGSQL